MAAPIGNSYALGNTGGHPPIIKTPEEMSQKITEYINYRDSINGKIGKGLYTLEGLALYLGYKDVQSLYDNEKRTEEFSYVVNRYRLFLIDWNVQKLYWGGTYMAGQFWLRNHGGYADETTQHQNTRITKIDIEVIKSDVPLSTSEKDVDV